MTSIPERPDPALAARLDPIVDAALARQESRGGHYRADFPATDPVGIRTFVTLDGREPSLQYAAE